jgi:hypothetical protein
MSNICSQPRLDAPNQCSEPVTSLGQLQRNEAKMAAAIALAAEQARADLMELERGAPPFIVLRRDQPAIEPQVFRAHRLQRKREGVLGDLISLMRWPRLSKKGAFRKANRGDRTHKCASKIGL